MNHHVSSFPFSGRSTQERPEALKTLRGLSIPIKILRTLHARASEDASVLRKMKLSHRACLHLNLLSFLILILKLFIPGFEFVDPYLMFV